MAYFRQRPTLLSCSGCRTWLMLAVRTMRAVR
ncbi:hypothetical protein [Novosphingobium sp. FKTRR1]